MLNFTRLPRCHPVVFFSQFVLVSNYRLKSDELFVKFWSKTFLSRTLCLSRFFPSRDFPVNTNGKVRYIDWILSFADLRSHHSSVFKSCAKTARPPQILSHTLKSPKWTHCQPSTLAGVQCGVRIRQVLLYSSGRVTTQRIGVGLSNSWRRQPMIILNFTNQNKLKTQTAEFILQSPFLW